MILAGMIMTQDVLHRFVFVSDKPAKTMNLAGSFNNWDKAATPMKLDSDGRTWSISIKLGFGRHYYKFVRNGEEWMVDPKAARQVDDGSGNTNSEVFILPPDFATPASRTDGQVAASAIRHTGDVTDRNLDNGILTLRLRTRKNDARSVRAVVNRKQVEAAEVSGDELYSTYEVAVHWDGKSKLDYRFELVDGAKSFSVGKGGLGDKTSFNLTSKNFSRFETPSWVPGSVIYQIFPDRFANGKTSNDPKGVMRWDGTPTYSNRFGGDAVGVQSKIPYLKSLGVSTVYFNPIFRSPSNHRYEADSYVDVDAEFGTNQEYFGLTRALKQNGIRTVLDFAFNHTSPNYKQFMDLRTQGANSKFKDWYFVQSFPIRVGENPNYTAWYGFPSMPKLNTVNPETTQHLLNVCDFWLKNSNLDGMRLDVANEVDMKFWRIMRPHVKKTNPNLWILGEIWGDGNPWLKGDQFDSVMNYQFRDAALKFIAKGTTTSSQFFGQLMTTHKSYPSQVSRNLMNLLSSHDTARFLTECNGNADLALLGAAIQFTWVGAPSVYYGEELGMEGGADPMNRKGMEWNKANASNRFLTTYKKLASLKRSSPALASSNIEILTQDDQTRTGSYLRSSKTDNIVVLFNRDQSEHTISINTPMSVARHNAKEYIDVLSGQRYSLTSPTLSFRVKPLSAIVLAPVNQSHSSPAPRHSNHLALFRRDSAQRRANHSNWSQKQP